MPDSAYGCATPKAQSWSAECNEADGKGTPTAFEKTGRRTTRTETSVQSEVRELAGPGGGCVTLTAGQNLICGDGLLTRDWLDC